MKTVRSLSPKVKILASAMVGRRNQDAGKGCEDVIQSQKCLEQGWAVLVLADGAGSAANAQLGAATSVATTIEVVENNYNKLYGMGENEVASFVAASVKSALEAKASVQSQPLASFASTLLFVMLINDRILLGQLGDGRIALLNSQQQVWHSTFDPEKGEFHNETVFTVSSNMHEKLQIRSEHIDNFSACVLMSDGAEESLFNREKGAFGGAVGTFYEWTIGNNSRRKVKMALDRSLQGPMRQKTFDDLSVAIFAKG